MTKTVAVIGTGDAAHRAIAVACAESGANVALATVARAQEFAVHSIANELWSIGVEHFVRVMDALHPTEAPAFADETWDRLGSCDAMIWAQAAPSTVPFEEMSIDEWRTDFALNLDALFLAVQAFGRNFERARDGLIILLTPPVADEDPAYLAALGARAALAAALGERWRARGVRVRAVDTTASATAIALG